jgi:hypothetical protein
MTPIGRRARVSKETTYEGLKTSGAADSSDETQQFTSKKLKYITVQQHNEYGALYW